MRFLSWVVTHRPTVLGGSQWDFLLCSMLAWLEVRQKSNILCCFVTLRLEARVCYRVVPPRAGKDSVSKSVEQCECFLSWGVELLNSGIWIVSTGVLGMLLCCPLINIFWLKYDFFQVSFGYTFSTTVVLYLWLTYAVPHYLLTVSACFQSQTASENVSGLWNPWVQLFVCENAALIVKLNQFFTSSAPDVLEKLPPELAGEWTDFFVEGIYNLLLPLPINITGVCVCGLYFMWLWHQPALKSQASVLSFHLAHH